MQKLTLPKKAIIFDMDGVLFDTEQFYYDRRKTFLDSKGISIGHLPPAYFIGGNMKQVWQAILGEDYANWDVSALQADYTAYKAQHPLPYQELLFPDVPASLQALKTAGFTIGLASSSTMEDIELALEVTGLGDYFAFALSGDAFPESKPHPAIYEAAVAQTGFAKEEVLVVEDSSKGIQAAVSAGLEVLAIADQRFGMDQSKATGLIASVKDLLALVG
ncbi:HAD family hydrolase [Streptococcus sp. DD12]|uniref:HAD family hydrolase n=1 Tax=Streptococcus sp. DD12 TaxID=1777880 RepID=UPI00079BE982|nr:HAD family phosphatase [Streptococcus sp. DD12]KXT75531.1 Hydrolase, haloacid dehalogenase-like family [Streptococcus sp. DD12]